MTIQNSKIIKCQNCGKEFQIEPEDFAFYKKMGGLPPVSCPDCRFKIRAQFRNETSLYSRKCDLCGKSIISMYNPKSPYIVYCESCYLSDKWDPYSYGISYNPNRPFLEQLGELLERVPKMATYSDRSRPSVNSEYINYAGGHKDCYLLFNSGSCENSMYSRGLRFCKDTVDMYFGQKTELCYEGVNVVRSAGIDFGKNVSGSVNSMFVLDVKGVQDCLGCVNLRYKNYHIFNQPVSKEEYKKRINEIKGSYSKTLEFQKKFDAFSLKFARKENNNLKAVNCLGDYIFDSKGLYHCFEAADCENCKYAYFVKDSKDSYDFTGFGYNVELLLECVAVGYSQRVIGSYWIEASHDIEYCFCVTSSEYCLGCDGQKHGQFSILNKKYSKEEFEKIRQDIIKELTLKGVYGHFIPPALAPFSYNETIAQDSFPLTKKEALESGFKWEDDLQMTKGKETLQPNDIPDYIKDVSDSITNEILTCISCGRNYKITVQELDFYKRKNIPIPRKCFYCRHHERIIRKGLLKLYDRKCANCGKEIKTTYAPDRPEIVYCERCYLAEVV